MATNTCTEISEVEAPHQRGIMDIVKEPRDRYEWVRAHRYVWHYHELNFAKVKDFETYFWSAVTLVDLKFDWERFIKMQDMILDWSKRIKDLPSAKAPQYLRYITVGRNRPVEIVAPYQTFYEGKYEGAPENHIYTDTFDVFKYDIRTHYRFTIGNFEAAFRITKPIWNILAGHRKKKANWEVIHQVCYEFLAGLRDVWTRRSEEEQKKMLRGAQASLVVPEDEELVVLPPVHPAAMRRTIIDGFNEEILVEKNVPVEENVTEVQAVRKPTSYEKYEEKLVRKFQRDMVLKPPDDPEDRKLKVRGKWTTCRLDQNVWYPQFEMQFYDPQYNPFGKLRLTYFTNLAELYIKIGRTDLAYGYPKLWYRRSRIEENTPLFRKFVHDEPMNYELEPQGKETEASQPMVSESRPKCVLKYRYDIVKVLTNLSATFLRHRDKMTVLSHRGRFNYLRNWDLALFERQKRILNGLDLKNFKEWITANKYFDTLDVKLPRTYVEEADYVVESVQAAIKSQAAAEILKALWSIIIIHERWLEAKFDPKKTACLEAHSAEEQVLKSDKPGQPSSGPALAADIHKPITEGEKHVNLTMVESKEVEKAVTSETKIAATKETTPETYSKIIEVVSKPMLIDKFTWDKSKELGRLKNYVVPNFYFDTVSKSKTVCQSLNAATQLSMFGVAKFNMRIRIQVNIVSMAQGMLIGVFRPFNDANRDHEILNNLTNYPHIFVQANASNVAEMKINWFNIRDAFPIYADPQNQLNYFGQFEIYCWNKYNIGENGSDGTSVSVFAWLEDIEPGQLTNPKSTQAVKFAPNIIGAGTQYMQHGDVAELTGRELRIASTSLWEPHSLERLLDKAADSPVSTTLQQTGAGAIESLYDSVLGKGGNCKPPQVLAPLPVQVQVMENTAQVEGFDPATRLAMTPLSVSKPNPKSKRKINIRDLVQQWSRLGILTWSVDDNENKSLASWPVSPVTTFSDPRKTTVDLQEIERKSDTEIAEFGTSTAYYAQYPTMLSWCAHKYMRWRGGIKFKLQIVKTNLHAGRIMIRYEPYGAQNSVVEECQKLATPGIIWDIKEREELEFVAPYASVQPYLTTQFVSAGQIDDDLLYRVSCGILEMLVINKLKRTTGIAPFVEINLYIAGASDFELSVVSPTDYIMQQRDIGRKYDGKGTAKEWSKIFSALYRFMSYPLVKQMVETVIETRGNDRLAWPKDPKLQGLLGLPLYHAASKSSNDFANNVVLGLEYATVKVDLKYQLPTFQSLGHAICWIERHLSQGDQWFKHTTEVIIPKWTKLEFEHNKFFHMLAANIFALQYNPFEIITPRFRNKYLGGVYLYNTELEPHSNDSAKGGQINPFKEWQIGTTTTEDTHEDHMDLYKLLKRYTEWCTMTIPGDRLTTDGHLANALFDIARMTDWEVKNSCWEWRIPVTPMTEYQKIGMKQCWLGTDWMNARVATNMITQEGWLTGGNVASRTQLAEWSEVFTTWRGSLRYKFTFDMNENSMSNWWCRIMHHPQQHTKWEFTGAMLKAVSRDRLRTNSRLGTTLWTGNVMSSINVEAPYYSCYKNLYLSSDYQEDWTTNGCLLVYFPIIRTSEQYIGNDRAEALKALKIESIPVTVWTAAGEDFDFDGRRSAPQTAYWYTYYNYSPKTFNMSYGWPSVLGNGGRILRPWGTVNRFYPAPRGDEVTRENPVKTYSRLEMSKIENDGKSNKFFKTLSSFQWNAKWKVGQELEPHAGGNDEEEILSDSSENTVVEQPISDGEVATTSNQGTDTDELDGAFQSVVHAAKMLPETLKDFREVATAARDTLTHLNKMVEISGDAVIASKEKVEATTDALTSTATTTGTVVKYAFNATRLAVFFKGLLDVFKAESWSDRWVPMASCALALGLAPEVVTSAGEWLMSWISSTEAEKANEPLTPHAYEDHWDKSWITFVEENAAVFRMGAAAVVTILTFWVTTNRPSGSKVSSFASDMINKLKNFTIVGTAIKTLDWLFKWIGTVLKEAAIWVGNYVTGGRITEYRMSNYYPEIVQWLREVDSFKHDDIKMELAWNPDARNKLWKCMDKGKELMEKINMKTGALFNIISRGIVQLQNAHTDMLTQKIVAPFRVDPFHICFTGEAGLGKSAIMKDTADFICDQEGYAEENRHFSRNDSDEYYTGYVGQTVVHHDDVYQDKKGNSLQEILKEKTNNPYQLNMASLEEKGRAFMSKLIMSSTNYMFPEHPDLHGPAVWRRRNLLVEVKRRGPGKGINSLVFRFIDPCDKSVKYLTAGMRFEEFLVLAAITFREYMMEQNKLVFAALRGRKIVLTDYGDKPVSKAIPVESKFDAFKELVRKKTQLGEGYLRCTLPQFSDDELLEISQMPESDYIKNTEAWKMSMKTKDEKIALESVYLKFITENVDNPAAREQMLQSGVIDQIWTVTPEVDNHRMVTCNVSGRQYDLTTGTKIAMEPHAGLDELLEGIDEEELTRERKKLQADAARFVALKEAMKANFEEVMKTSLARKPGKVVTVLNETEMANFVNTHFASRTEDERKEMAETFGKIFEKCHNRGLLDIHVEDANFAPLFSKENDKHWKQDPKKNWIMVFDETFEATDKGMELKVAYDNMILHWTREKINEYKNAVHRDKTCYDKLEANSQKVIDWLEKKRSGIVKWFEDHPRITKMIKLATSLGLIFAGYKLLDYFFADTMKSIKDTIKVFFGWGVTKAIGEEGYEHLKTLPRRGVTYVKDRVGSGVDYLKSLMIRSEYPEVQQAITDPEMLELMQETMPKMVRQAHTVASNRKMAMEAEGKQKVYKNPYMLGETIQLQPEGRERLSEKFGSYEPHGCEDPNAYQLQRKLVKNAVTVLWARPNGNTVEMSGLFVAGRTLMVPYHFFLGCEEGTMFCMTNSSGVKAFDVFEPKRCVKLEGQDLCLYECCPKTGQFSDITKHFASPGELRVERTKAILSILTPLGVMVHVVDAALEYEVDYPAKDGTLLKNRVGWQYCSAASKGDCGGVLIAMNVGIANKILGIHTAGGKTNNIGFSACVWRQDLLDAMKQLEPFSSVKPTPIVPESLITKGVSSMKFIPQGNFEHYGAVEDYNATRLPHKTEIIPSAIHDLVRPHVTEPAVLTARDPRNESGESPLGKAVGKYGVPTLPFQPRDLDLAAEWIQNEMMTWEKPMEARLLTDYEAVWGNENIPYCERMNMDASAGYPWTKLKPSGYKGKSWLFDANADDGIAVAEYRNCYQAREKLARAGIRKISLWTDCLKDERRPLKKIKEGKTRAFMLPPADFIQLCRKYFMAFSVCFYSNNGKSFSAVGVDPFSYDWTRIMRRLRRISPDGFGGDFHSYDGIFDPDIAFRICKQICAWYRQNDKNWTKEDDIVREVLFEEMIHTVHICLNSIYRKFQGNPSGNPLTVILNTIGHVFYMVLSFLEIMRLHAPEYCSMYWFAKLVKGVYYGDDGLTGVHRLIQHLFNLEKVSEALRKHGIEYTSESKEGMYQVRPLKDCTFLKCGFKKDGDLWLAPIAEDTIYELTNWIHVSDDPLGQLRENIENAKRFAFHHGKDWFARFGQKVNSALNRRGLRLCEFSYPHEKEQWVAKCRS